MLEMYTEDCLYGRDHTLEQEESGRNPATVDPPLQEKAHQVSHLNRAGEKHRRKSHTKIFNRTQRKRKIISLFS